jgi:ABC-type dipeptide/oligopeptide/nickel transport system permease component
MLAVVLLVFVSLHLAPGDPIDMLMSPEISWTDPEAREAEIQRLRERYGLDRPLHEQFLIYVLNISRFDFGTSIRSGRSVSEEIPSRYLATVELAVAALIISVTIGITVGVASAVYPNSLLDTVTTTLALAGVSIPSFWFGLLLMLLFALHLRWLPPSGRPASALTPEGFKHVVLPSLALGIYSSGILVRLTRSQMLEVLNEGYVVTARAKGLDEFTIVFRHALKNAFIPIVTMIGLQFGGLLAGAIVVETVFAYPGLGRYLLTGVTMRDFPAVQASVLLVSLSFVTVNLLVDIIYAALDPRIRY